MSAFASFALMGSLLTSVTAASATTTISGLTPVSYTEGSGPVTIAPAAVVTESGSFADGYLEFSVTGATSSETLSLPTVSTPDPSSGAVSVIGTAVYLGLGGSAYKQIGTVDPVKNGEAGQALRVNFSAVLPNADFTGAVTGSAGAQTPAGWTINRSYVGLGSLASKSQGRAVTKSGSGPYTITGSGYSFQTDVNYNPASRAQWGYESKERGVTTATHNSSITAYSGHTESLRLYFNGTCPGPNDTSYCAAFGPEALSSTFAAKAGDSLAFDWAAANGGDDYEVYGFLVNQDTSATTELMYGRGGISAWSTTSGTIPADGNYRFRFVAGSYDKTGGFAIGASLYIDNVRVLSNDFTAAVAQSVTRMVRYENTSDNPPPSRTITVVTSVAGGPAASGTAATAITAVDDPPTVGTIAATTFNNTIADDTFTTATGTLPGSDPEGDPIVYDLSGSTSGSTVIGAVTYDRSVIGTYGTMYVASATGAWAFVPNTTTVNARLTADTESFGVIATALGLTGTGTIPIAIAIPASVPGNATAFAATGGNANAALSWTAPVWLGGSAITGYKIERSTDGTNWSVAVANTGDATTSAQVTGLTNGTTYQFRVTAINATGPSTPSSTASATPGTTPAAPTATAGTPGDTVATVTWTAPGDDGGSAITGYRLETSTDGGTNWVVAIANTGTTATTVAISGLTNGTPTDVRVLAINGFGAGTPSVAATVTSRTVPGRPTGVQLTPGNAWVVADWTAPADNGGSPITGYRVETSTDGGATWEIAIANTASASTSALIGSQTNGTPVRVRVAAISVAGTGLPSGANPTATPRTVPSAPSISSITPGNRRLTVNITPPADNGGAPITNYEYSLDGGANWITSSPSTATGPLIIGRLPNGEAANVQVRAVNAAGVGAASPTRVGTPVAMPIPTNTPSTASAGGGQILVDGTEEPIKITETAKIPGDTSPSGTLRATGGGVTLDVLSKDQNGDPQSVAPDGRLPVIASGTTRVTGTGYRPGSTVDVWLMPGAIPLGTVTVGADGTFGADLPIPDGVSLGDHTLQVNGVGPDNATRSVTIDVEVLGATLQRSPGELAFTGGTITDNLLLGAALVTGGIQLTKRRRRRKASGGAAR